MHWTAVDDGADGYGDCWRADADTGTVAAADGRPPAAVCYPHLKKIPPRRTDSAEPCSPGGAVARGQRMPACSPVQMIPPNYRQK